MEDVIKQVVEDFNKKFLPDGMENQFEGLIKYISNETIKTIRDKKAGILCVVCGGKMFSGEVRFSWKHPCCEECWETPERRKMFENSLKKEHPEIWDWYVENFKS